jgi:hypothetical protein
MKCGIYVHYYLKNGESRETGNIDEEKQKHNIICVGHHYTQITLIKRENI